MITKMSVIASGFIILGLCLRFGGEQFGGAPLVKYLGVTLYLCGWFITAACLSFKYNLTREYSKHCIFSMILVSAMWVIFEFKNDSTMIQPQLPLISCSVLLSLILALVLERNFKDVLMTVIASCLIILSEYVILPFQRDNNINDGLGLPCFLLGWLILFRGDCATCAISGASLVRLDGSKTQRDEDTRGETEIMMADVVVS